jgi:predicted esterase
MRLFFFLFCLLWGGHARAQQLSLDALQKRHFNYFWALAYPNNFQVPDRYPKQDFSSVAATGFGLSVYLVGIERGWITRKQGAERVMRTLKFLWEAPQGPQASGVTGYKGWFYHFLNIGDGTRFKTVELSSIDTGLLMAGVLSCMTYFDGNNETERYIRETADALFRRVEFDFFLNTQNRLSMGWFPERDGFLCADWRGYNEAMLLNIMALGSPTHPVPTKIWEKWCEPYFRATFYGQDHVNFGPLFGHQYSHCWIDFHGIQDAYMREMRIDYFENSRRATLAQQQYAIENPGKFKGYSSTIFGLTAGDGPDAEMLHEGKKIFCPGYGARGVAIDYLEDDGTIAPTAAVSALPFAPEICMPAITAMAQRWPVGEYGFFDGYNETFTQISTSPNAQAGYPFWVDRDYLGIDQGPIVLMIENHRSQFLWNLMRRNPYIVQGLKRAGFTGGWLDEVNVKALNKGIVFADGEKAVPNPAIPLDQHGFFKRAVFTDTEGGTLNYQMAQPTQAASQKKYPLVVFLHGSGERGLHNTEHMKNGVHAFCEQWVREQHPHYLLVPQCPPEQRWSGGSRDWPQVFPEEPTAINRRLMALIQATLQAHPDIDRNRIYITGLSMGGFGTFDLLMRYPDLFAAAVPVCGGADVRYLDRIRHIPMWVFHGGLDDVVLPRCSREPVATLQRMDAPVKYTEYSTLYHDIWNMTYYNPETLKWLFQQHKKE